MTEFLNHVRGREPLEVLEKLKDKSSGEMGGRPTDSRVLADLKDYNIVTGVFT